MTDTPNIGLKKYGITDPANLISGYNASMDTLDTVIKQAQDDIDALDDSVTRKVGLASSDMAYANNGTDSNNNVYIEVSGSDGRYLLGVGSYGIRLFKWDTSIGNWVIKNYISVGNNTTVSFDQYSSGRYLGIGVKGGPNGAYSILFNNSGISVYDEAQSRVIHSIPWAT